MKFRPNPHRRKMALIPKLDDCDTPDDNTDLNASTSVHGLLLKLDNNTSNFLRGDGTWAAPALPRGYFEHGGFILSNDTDADHDINITVGETRDTTDGYDLSLTSEITKQIDAIFAAGDDAGGMGTGSVAADTWYHMYVIRKDSDASIDVYFDTSISAANIPTGYTYWRYLGSVLTDGSSNIIAFVHINDHFWWLDPPLDVNVTNLGTSAVLYTISTPLGIEVEPIGNMGTKQAAGLPNVYARSPSVANDEPPSGSAGPLGNIRSIVQAKSHYMGPVHGMMTNTSSQISARSSLANTTFQWCTLGYHNLARGH